MVAAADNNNANIFFISYGVWFEAKVDRKACTAKKKALQKRCSFMSQLISGIRFVQLLDNLERN